jgi:hypothetical protein
MTAAPGPVVILLPFQAGADWGRKTKPNWRRAQRSKEPPNRPVQPIPVPIAQQREALLQAGRRVLAEIPRLTR